MVRYFCLMGIYCWFFTTGLWSQREIALLNMPIRPLTATTIVPGEQIVMPFDLDRGMIYVQAEVDGVRGQFILDTGAPGLVLNEIPQASADNPYSAQSSGGEVSVGMKRVGRFEWAGRKLKWVEAVVVNLDHLEAVHQSPIKGMIGYDLLKEYFVFLDYSRRQLIIRADGAPPLKPAVIFPFELDGHLPVVTVNVQGVALRLGLDTGAAANLLDKKWQHLFPAADSDAVMGVQGLDQAVQRMPMGTLSGLRVQDEVFDATFVRMDLSHLQTASGQPLDGLLGYSFLSDYQIAIDYKTGRLLLW